MSKMKNTWEPRQRAIIFADEDVDGVCSAAIVGRRYDSDQSKFVFVNARNLGYALKSKLESIEVDQENPDVDVFIVDVGINKANIRSIERSISELVKKKVRVLYFDSHSNKYKGQTLLLHLTRAKAHVFNGRIGSAAASIVQDFMGSDETMRLRLLGALSDREIQLTHRYRHEKIGLRSLQASVAWGAWKDRVFLDKITRRLIMHPDLDLEGDKDILEYAIKANNHRDNLLRHVHKHGKILQISETPRILSVAVLDRIDFGKARGTIAGRLAGEWGAAIILITQAVQDKDCYAVTVRNSYIHKLDLELLGQLAKTTNSGGSKGAYRLTILKDDLLGFISKVQAWSRSLSPPWLMKTIPKKLAKPRSYRSKRRKFPKPSRKSRVVAEKEVKPEKEEEEETKPNSSIDDSDLAEAIDMDKYEVEEEDDDFPDDVLDLDDVE
ncbi:MAG: hypothetical protein ACXAD7_00310 [Candidatus Kariarchaeaceae archaeon]|jgi:oligoribonuclease NrnB/cAMP/cGMP phosphodiesterase (DHH superfamily)